MNAAVLVWVFLMVPTDGKVPVQAGPFVTEEVCRQAAEWVEPWSSRWWTPEHRDSENAMIEAWWARERARRRVELQRRIVAPGFVLDDATRKEIDPHAGMTLQIPPQWADVYLPANGRVLSDGCQAVDVPSPSTPRVICSDAAVAPTLCEVQ